MQLLCCQLIIIKHEWLVVIVKLDWVKNGFPIVIRCAIIFLKMKVHVVNILLDIKLVWYVTTKVFSRKNLGPEEFLCLTSRSTPLWRVHPINVKAQIDITIQRESAVSHITLRTL